MGFLYESRIYPSEKNGDITCFRILGQWNVRVQGCGQTTSYTNAMWKNAIGRIPRNSGIKRALMLGLGAGGMIDIVRKRLGNCSITAIEWDPTMVQIAKDLGSNLENLNVILGDAHEEVPRLKEKFDLILVDIFQGPKVSSPVHQQSFFKALSSVLARDGYLLCNVFRESELLANCASVLSQHSVWRFQSNTLGLYRHYGQGMIGDPLSPGYISHKQSLEYLGSNWSPWSNASIVGKEGAYGIRLRLGKIAIETYETDKEPALLPGPARMIIWQQLSRHDKPQGWFRSWIPMGHRRTGYAEIKSPEAYREPWTSHAKRHLNKWLDSQPYLLEETFDIEGFIENYKKLQKLHTLKGAFIGLLRQHAKFHNDLLHLFVARDRGNGSIVAGLAVVDLPDINQSHHLISFIHSVAKTSSVGTGLIDYWFRHAVSRRIRFLNFGAFWKEGDPQSWRGFSRFKSQFGIYFIDRPRPLVRFVGNSQ